MSTETAPVAPTTTTTETTPATVVNNEGGTEATTTYLDGKYDSVSALESGYKELQSSYSKKLGGFDGSPEAYTRAEGIPENDPLHTYASEWGKENQMSDKGLNEFVEGYNKQQAEGIEAYQSEQIALLGDDAKYRLENVNDFLKANTNIDDVALKQINDGLFGAKGIEVLEQLISLNKNPSPTAAPVVAAPTMESIQAEQFKKDANGNRLSSTSPEHRAKVLKMKEAFAAANQ
jgi:hypothetical protein